VAMRLKRLIDKFLQWCEKTRKPTTTANYRWLLLKFLKHVRNKPIDKLVPADLEAYGKTWHEVQSVQRLFQWAKDSLRIIQENPFSKVKRPPARQRTRIFSRPELTAYLRKCRREFRDFLIAMRGTMARPQELRAVIWPQLQAPVDWPGTIEEALAAGRAMFVLWEYKSRERMANPNRPRVIMMTRRVGRLILRLRSRAISLEGRVFLNSKSLPWTSNAIRCRFRRLRAKLPSVTRVNGENLVTYSMRHTSATNASPKVTQKELADLLGHQSVRTTERYQHLQLDHLHDAMEKVQDETAKLAKREERKKGAKAIEDANRRKAA